MLAVFTYVDEICGILGNTCFIDSIELYIRAKCCREEETSEDAWGRGGRFTVDMEKASECFPIAPRPPHTTGGSS